MDIPITVLMTVYNNEKYIRKAIQSILNQTFTNFEFLIIDDGGQDNSLEIIKSFKDQRIRIVLQEKNCGQTASLNLGLRIAKGKYIARMDADDISLPRRLEEQFAFVQNHPKDFGALGTQIKFIDGQEHFLYKPCMPKEEGNILWHSLFTSPLYHSSVLFEKKIVLAVGGYNESFVYAQDHLLWVQLLKHGKRIYNLNLTPLVLARLHSESVTARGSEKRTREAVLVTQAALGSLLQWSLNFELSKCLNLYLCGQSLEEPSQGRMAMQLMKECYKKLQARYDVSLFWGLTLFRLALCGKNIGFFRRVKLISWSLPATKHIKLLMKEYCWRGILFFIYLTRRNLSGVFYGR